MFRIIPLVISFIMVASAGFAGRSSLQSNSNVSANADAPQSVQVKEDADINFMLDFPGVKANNNADAVLDISLEI